MEWTPKSGLIRKKSDTIAFKVFVKKPRNLKVLSSQLRGKATACVPGFWSSKRSYLVFVITNFVTPAAVIYTIRSLSRINEAKVVSLYVSSPMMPAILLKPKESQKRRAGQFFKVHAKPDLFKAIPLHLIDEPIDSLACVALLLMIPVDIKPADHKGIVTFGIPGSSRRCPPCRLPFVPVRRSADKGTYRSSCS